MLFKVEEHRIEVIERSALDGKRRVLMAGDVQREVFKKMGGKSRYEEKTKIMGRGQMKNEGASRREEKVAENIK